IEYALLAQLDRVFGYEPKGQGFESLAAHQKHRILSCAFLFCRGGRAPAGSPKAPSVGSCLRRRLMRGDLPARINLRKNTDSVKQALCKREGPGLIRRFSNSHIKKPGASVRTHRVFLCGHSRPTAATAFTCGMRLTGL